MSSERLPGKMLATTNGKKLLSYVIESVMRVKQGSALIILTSTEKSDDPIVYYCEKTGINYIRGSLDNVVRRYKDALELTDCDAFVRVCGDSPLIDYRLVEKGIELFINGNYDIVTNTHPRTFPSGQSVEVVRSSSFLKAFEFMQGNDELEHVTKHFYNNPERYNIYNFTSKNDYSSVKLSVDTYEDLHVFEEIINKMNKAHYQYNYLEIIELYNTVKQNR